jgi:hypothetical protein
MSASLFKRKEKKPQDGINKNPAAYQGEIYAAGVEVSRPQTFLQPARSVTALAPKKSEVV